MIRAICTFIFRLSGWKYVNNVPADLRSFVLIGAPHTSNFDFIPAMACAHKMGRVAKFVIKSDWLKFPLNLLMVPAGAHGIDRSKLKETERRSNIDVMAELFKQFPELVLMISPEGTRGPNAKWRAGFYHVAQKAQVPIVLGYLDYPNKEAGLGMILYPTDFEQDMRTIMQFYSKLGGKRPENFKLDERFS